ncbi:MAG: NPCBM/NEW2 domain-containing protein, partial [Patescibacteria group bacterium]|nr:NPCBM/NEW2 domain-containing protein [Patescibacteria group bacterium]
LRQLIPPPPEMQNRNYLFGYGWIGLEANLGLEHADYRPQLIGGTESQAAARLTHLQQRLKRHSAGLIVPAILGKVENDAQRYEAAVGEAVRRTAELTADVIYTAVFLAMQDEAAGEPPEAAHLRELSLTDFLPDTDAGSTRHPYYVVPYLVNQSMDDRRALHPLEIADGVKTFQPANGYGMGVPYTLPFTLALGGEYREFRTTVGLTPQAGERASVSFEVLVNGESVAKAGPIRRGDAARKLHVALPPEPVFKLELRTTTEDAEYPLHNLSAWGDPTLVLRAALANGHPAPR